MSDSEDSSLDVNEYTIEDYYKLVKPLLQARNTSNTNYLNDHKLLRTLVDFNLSHSLSLKNLAKRELEIGDLIPTKINYIDTLVVKFSAADPTAFAPTTGTPYTTHYAGCFRNRYVEFCPHFAISAYLFSRFHIPDEYGSYEFIFSDSSKKISLENVKLIKGNNKLSAISYSQQHKSSINALSISGLNYKDVNLTKLLSTHDIETTEKLASKSIQSLSNQVMLNLSGFRNFEEYSIVRNSLEPPESLLNKIFPFVDDIQPESYSKEMLQVKELLIMLRKSLVQDMVIIKKKYPLNPLSKSDLFSSIEFLEFLNSVEAANMLDTIINQSMFSPDDDKTESDVDDTNSWPSVNQELESNPKDLNKIIEFQNNKIKALDHLVNNVYKQQQEKTNELLRSFIDNQNAIFQNQSEALLKISNSINGLIILLTSQNKNALSLVNQTLQETSNYIKTIEQTNLQRGVDNTVELLNNLSQVQAGSQQQQQQQQPPQRPLPSSQPSTAGSIASTQPTSAAPASQPQIALQPPPQASSVPPPVAPPTLPPHLPSLIHQHSQGPSPPSHIHPPQVPATVPSVGGSQLQHTIPLQAHQYYLNPTSTPPQHRSTPMSPIPQIALQQQQQQQAQLSQQPINLTPQQMERQRALHRRLSRQATTLFEMWDDFKGLEKELRDHDITVTEWLKIHGSSERQFRHTRLKIIKFIEEEAVRRRTTVDAVKERLHNKMRNRVRPWTLDEVQRMLTANKRIDLDDNS
ncbi:hypothetical protein Cantr_07001 [Candida viswanathii]|uniref:Ndc10 domain-containing protein n=1 Tax=Candida viswanathii TaxID=5486 RepID=A0A367XUY8_9ASCO|nr:hypothetical protein Cantr_07001 [Candida viswanathii]